MAQVTPGHRQSSVHSPKAASTTRKRSRGTAGISQHDALTDRGLSALRPDGWSDTDARHYLMSASTARAYDAGKIRPPRQGQIKTAPGGLRRWFRRGPWDRRKPLTIKVKYMGGGECWYEIHARGSAGRFPGYVALHDVMWEIFGECNHDRA